MKVSPLETANKFNVLITEETQDKCFLKPKPNCIRVIYYVSKFISKLQRATLRSQKSNLITGYTWLHKHNPEVDWETGKEEMTRCPWECNVSERRQKGIKKRIREVGEEKPTKTRKVTIEEEIDADMPNVVEPIMIEKMINQNCTDQFDACVERINRTRGKK